jgi:NitT/TauT family transport system substrate-binding protein
MAKRWISAQIDLARWIRQNEDEAKRLFNGELKAETGRALPGEILDRAWAKLELTHDPIRASLLKSAEDAFRIGFLKEAPDLSRIYDLKLLNETLREKKLPEVP